MNFLRFFSVIMFANMAFSPALSEAASASKPNILIFLVDDMGWQDTSVPFYYNAKGTEITTPLNQFYKTPAMENLAKAGIKFTNAYAAPVCSPSRTSLMTGKTPARHHVSTWTAAAKPTLNDEVKRPGMCGADWRIAGMDPKETTLPKLLKTQGYRTISVGKAHFAPINQPLSNPKNLGFDVNIAGNGIGGPGSYRSDQNFVKSNLLHQVPGMEKYHTKGQNPSPEKLQQNFLTRALTSEMADQLEAAIKDKKPFLAYMTHYAVHSTHEDPDPNADKNTYSNRLPALQPGTSQNKNYLANYATLIEGMDQSLATLVQKLKDLGVAKDTLILFISDNGGDAPIQQSYGGDINFIEQIGAIAPLRGRKGSRYEGGTRVPMIMAWAEEDPSNPLQQRLSIKPNSANHHIVAIWDILPTLTKLCGAPTPKGIDGVDISPLITNKGTNKRPNSISQHFPHAHTYGNFYSSYREGDWKILYSYEDEYNNKGVFPWKLFNLKEDIGESNDLALNPTYREKVESMAKRLIEDLKKSGAQYPRLINSKNREKITREAVIKMPRFPK